MGDRTFTVAASVSKAERAEIYEQLRAQGWGKEASPVARVVLLAFSRSSAVKNAVHLYVADHPEIISQ